MKRLKKILRILLRTTVVLVVVAFLGFWTIRYTVWQENIQTYYNEIELDDGPYVFWEDDATLRMLNIHNVSLEENPSGFLDILQAASSQELPAQYETTEFTIDLRDTTAALQEIESLGIAIDPYAMLEIPGAIFEAERVAAMGDGHLVFVGDVFDKGPGVTESLWLIYRLEQQARAAGR